MQLPGFLQGDAPTRLVHGAIVGVLATVLLGFGWGGWTLVKTAKEMASQSAKIAVVTALAPICVDKFQHSADAATNLTELKRSVRGNKAPLSRRAAGRHCPAATRPTRP